MSSLASDPCSGGVALSTNAQPCSPTAGHWVLAASILGSSMAFIDGTVVSVALPVLQQDLGATVSSAQWIVEAYALFLSSLVLVGGSLADRFGRRRIFVIGAVAFAAASLACGLAPDARSIIIAGWPSGRSIDSEDTMAFAARTGVRSRNELFPLDRAAAAYDRMMSGDARFRVVLTT
jgi:MFS family permease